MANQIQVQNNQEEITLESFGAEQKPGIVFDEKTKKIIEEMLQAGVQYGRSKSLTNPLMEKYLLKLSREIEIFDLIRTLENLDKATDYLVKALGEKKIILFVGAKPAAQNPIKDIAQSLKMPYVVEHWLGGILTNFKTLSQRIKYLKDLKTRQQSPDWEKYPKKERQEFLKEIKKLEESLGGVVDLDRLPDVVFIVDAAFHRTALNEAKKLKIPIVAIAGSDNNPRGIEQVIPANDKAPSSINYLINYLKNKLAEVKINSEQK